MNRKARAFGVAGARRPIVGAELIFCAAPGESGILVESGAKRLRSGAAVFRQKAGRAQNGARCGEGRRARPDQNSPRMKMQNQSAALSASMRNTAAEAMSLAFFTAML